jgi:hypothetical protein
MFPAYAMQAKGARLVAVASVKGSELEAVCDMAVHLPLERELCPFDLAPVTSTAIQMVFGDTVAIALMQVGADSPPPGCRASRCLHACQAAVLLAVLEACCRMMLMPV